MFATRTPDDFRGTCHGKHLLSRFSSMGVGAREENFGGSVGVVVRLSKSCLCGGVALLVELSKLEKSRAPFR